MKPEGEGNQPGVPMGQALPQRWPIFLVMSLLALQCGCASSRSQVVQPDYAKWQQIRPGMSEEKVEALVGKPIRRDDPDWYKQTGDDPAHCSYGATYGLIQFDSLSLPSRYEFSIGYHCKDRTVADRYDPFGGVFSAHGRPTVPKLLTPAADQLFNYYPRFTDFRWSPSSGVYPMRYEVQLNWQEEDGWTGPAVVKLTADCPYLCHAWVGANRGVWRVRAINRLGQSDWSEARHFKFDR